MLSDDVTSLGRRSFLTQAVPACAGACMAICGLPPALLCAKSRTQEPHKFDVPREFTMSIRQRNTQEYRVIIDFIKVLQGELPEPDLIRFLNAHSANWGRQIGETQARRWSDTSFAAFVNQYRPPRYASSLTHEVVEDTETSFGLRVTECVTAEVFHAAGLGGEIGHAAVCNMDYHWPTGFNPSFRMERTRTLMRGDNECNHRYINPRGTN